MNAIAGGFTPLIDVSASTEGGAEWFPYGFKISLRQFLAQAEGLDLETIYNNGVVMMTEPDPDHDWEACPDGHGLVLWQFSLPQEMPWERIAARLGWHKPLAHT